jgi:hypothetical protein
MTSKEIADFVMDWCNNNIFTNRHLNKPEDIFLAFPILSISGMPK